MVRPGRDQLSGLVEVDETYVGGPEEHMGRGAVTKTLVVIAVEKRGRAFGRTRMSVIEDASKDSLCGFICNSVALGSTVRTDGWPSYLSLKESGYVHDRVVPRNNPQSPSELLPGVHLVVMRCGCQEELVFKVRNQLSQHLRPQRIGGVLSDARRSTVVSLV